MQILTSKANIEQALFDVNKKYENNVVFNRLDRANEKDTRYNVTLRVVSSKGKGARLSAPSFWSGKQRRLVSACWHVHYDFFDALPTGTKVISNWGHGGKHVSIAGEHGTYQDMDVGSMMLPALMSELCECED